LIAATTTSVEAGGDEQAQRRGQEETKRAMHQKYSFIQVNKRTNTRPDS
jgi:hypothetical protein